MLNNNLLCKCSFSCRICELIASIRKLSRLRSRDKKKDKKNAFNLKLIFIKIYQFCHVKTINLLLLHCVIYLHSQLRISDDTVKYPIIQSCQIQDYAYATLNSDSETNIAKSTSNHRSHYIVGFGFMPPGSDLVLGSIENKGKRIFLVDNRSLCVGPSQFFFCSGWVNKQFYFCKKVSEMVFMLW